MLKQDLAESSQGKDCSMTKKKQEKAKERC